jgi:hypothetical protein
VTDFRRPDLDLWDEEDDGEDQRPTIVSERPPAPAGLPPLARMSLAQRLIAKGELEDSEDLKAALLAQRQGTKGARPAPAAATGRQVSPPSPIETAAREAADGRDSTEILDEQELDLMRLSEPGAPSRFDGAAGPLDAARPLSAPLPQTARLTEPFEAAQRPRQAAEEPHEALLVRPRTQPGVPRPHLSARAPEGARGANVNAELPAEATEVRPPAALTGPGLRAQARAATDAELPREASALHRMDQVGDDPQFRRHPQMSEEDFVPTRLARRPRSQAPATQRVPPEILETPVFRDREITERISIPPLATSIAPATRTVRPNLRPQKGMGGWQLALVAMLLIGAGLGVARLRRESAAAALTARVRSAVSAALEPSRAAEVIAQADPQAAPEPTVAPAQADPAPAEPAGMAQAGLGDPASELAQAVADAERAQRKGRAAQEPSGAKLTGSRAELRAARAAEGPASNPAQAPASAAVRAPAADEARVPSDPASRPAAKPAQESASDLAAQPSREQVRAALDAVIPELQKCTGNQHGTADVTMTVRSAGVVSYAVVAGSFAGTPEGSCIARTVKLAKFPPFSEPSMRVSYPFEL